MLNSKIASKLRLLGYDVITHNSFSAVYKTDYADTYDAMIIDNDTVREYETNCDTVNAHIGSIIALDNFIYIPRIGLYSVNHRNNILTPQQYTKDTIILTSGFMWKCGPKVVDNIDTKVILASQDNANYIINIDGKVLDTGTTKNDKIRDFVAPLQAGYGVRKVSRGYYNIGWGVSIHQNNALFDKNAVYIPEFLIDDNLNVIKAYDLPDKAFLSIIRRDKV